MLCSLPGPSNPNLAKEEKKKEIDKKEREMRRKFKVHCNNTLPGQNKSREFFFHFVFINFSI